MQGQTRGPTDSVKPFGTETEIQAKQTTFGKRTKKKTLSFCPYTEAVIIMSPQSYLPATNRNWSFGKMRVSGKWIGARTVEVASGHIDAVTETLIYTCSLLTPWG